MTQVPSAPWSSLLALTGTPCATAAVYVHSPAPRSARADLENARTHSPLAAASAVVDAAWRPRARPGKRLAPLVAIPRVAGVDLAASWIPSSVAAASAACVAVLRRRAQVGNRLASNVTVAGLRCSARERRRCLGMGVWLQLHTACRAVSDDTESASASGEANALSWSLDDVRVRTLAVLLAIFVSNQACRALLFYLVDFGPDADPARAMNAVLDFGAGEYGFLATIVFTVPFTIASLAAGLLSDGGDRMRFSGLAGLAWSAITVSMAFAFSYDTLLGQRALLGVSQAATNPAALSLIGELFPEARATASSIFGLGIYVGGGLASLGAAVDEQIGWRNTCAAFGFSSALVSVLAFTIADPRPPPPLASLPVAAATTSPNGSGGRDGSVGGAADAVAGAWGGALAAIREATAPEPARWLFLASALRFCAGFSILVWLPPVARAHFPGRVEDFAACNAFIKVVAGGASSLAGGLIADALRSRGYGDRGGALFCAASSLAAAPLWYLVLQDGLSFEGCMGCLLVEYLVAESWLGPAVATLQSSVPVERRGAAQGVFSALTAIGNAVPVALGMLASEDLTAGLQSSVAVCYLLSAVCFLGAANSLPEDTRH